MKQRDKIILIGGGGHCKSVIDVIEAGKKYTIAGILDVKGKVGTKILKYKIFDTDNNLPALAKKKTLFLITVGHTKSNVVRRKLYDKLKGLRLALPIVASPLAYCSRNSEIAEGTVLMHRSFVNSFASIGVNCILNTGAIVEHDAEIGNHCHISTNAVINGGTKLGDNVFIGSGSVVNECIEICNDVVIGSGSVVNRNIVHAGIYAGSPVKKIN